MSKRIEDIRLIVEVRHDCTAKHECSVPVIEMYGKDKIWEGVVEMFALTGHPKAKRCYAWIFAHDDAELRYITVLEQPPVYSPYAAVRAAIASGQQK
jgi:hypothetical protein